MNKYKEALKRLEAKHTYSEKGVVKAIFDFKMIFPLEFASLRELVDKETPVIPIEIDSDDPCYCNIDYFCPKCREQVYEEDNKYCNKCGQKLDWSEE